MLGQFATWMKQAITHNYQIGKNACFRPAKQVPSDWKQSYIPCRGNLFTLPAMSFYFWWFPLLTDLLLKFFLSNLLVFLFTFILCFSVKPHQVVIFILDTKVIPAQAIFYNYSVDDFINRKCTDSKII